MATIEDVLEQLEDLFQLINKAQINIKKCPKSRLSRGYVQTRIKCIEEYWEAYRASHVNLLRLTTKDERQKLEYFVQDKHAACEDLYTGLRADLLDMLEPAAPLPLNLSTSSERDAITSDIKLPRINLPTFSGAYEEWQSFEDTFKTLIYNNNSLNEVQKLHYLKSCLCGEAKNTIKHFQIIKNNFHAAWDTLKERYSHKRLIINAVLKRLFSIKKLNNQASGQLKTLIDSTKECLSSLNNLGINTDTWDAIVIYLIVQKLDTETHKDWEHYVSKECSDSMPALNILINFLENRIRTLELTSGTMLLRDNRTKEKGFIGAALIQSTCVFCNNNHNLYHCKEFSKLEPEKRKEFVKEKRLCFNCLSAGHPFYHCKQKVSCKICSKRHHSLLHSSRKSELSLDSKDGQNATGLTSMYTNVEGNKDIQDVYIASHFTSENRNVLLATALVPVRSSTGHISMLRALIDPGSQASFVSERAVQLLQLQRTEVQGKVTGVGSIQTSISQVVQLEVLSNYVKSFSLKVKAYVLSTHLTSNLPCKYIKVSKAWSHIQGLNLADPNYYAPAKIDILLGVEVYTEILKNNFIKGPSGSPCAQETGLGWILFGSISDDKPNHTSVALCNQINVDEVMKSMWELQPTSERLLTAEERLCEEIYTNTHRRRSDGRYIVKLPIKKCDIPIATKGNTREIAMKRLISLERRFERDPDLRKEYEKVIQEYIDKKYIEEVPMDEINRPAIYLPHHPVVRKDKETTKVRVVFDASAKGCNNVSLNDELLVGPPLQEDLRNLIMRWRLRRVCFTADIQKMYLMILVDKGDVDYQRILWRTGEGKPKDYRLLRVTFGTASAPYLAVKTLQQVANDESKDNSKVAKIIKEDFFVDDLISGSDTVEEAIETAFQIKDILEKGGFVLQKWASNSIEFMEQIPPSQRSTRASINLTVDGITKALGLSWNMGQDTLEYHLSIQPQPEMATKRMILSELQKLFDPLGWLAPAIVLYKMLIQELWVKQIGWDEEVDCGIRNEWLRLREGFTLLNDIKLQRWLGTTEDLMDTVEIHGFSDASTKAYAAVAYIRVQTKDGAIRTSIIAAKTRVAPVKPVSLARLELCGSLLLSRLLKQISEAMRIPITQIYAWTDSEVVLSWLAGDPLRWNVFVSNRVVEITDNIPYAQWYHVASKSNPADIASRGLILSQLVHNKLWWAGPDWLKGQNIILKRPIAKETDMEERKCLKVYHSTVKKNNLNLENFDSLEELQRVIVHCKRFINSKKQPENIINSISCIELEEAFNIIIKLGQREEFEEEINTLMEKKPVNKKSKLKSLNPYIDEKGIIRVGGRLRHASVAEDVKHPIILGHDNAVVKLIVAYAHRKTLHGGVQLMLCFLRSRFWIIKAKSLVKAQVHKCFVCAIQRAKNREQMMGDLPSVRVTPARPFMNSGVDFAGPLQLLTTRGRGGKCIKAYIAIFVCMATKAIHLELVGDLTTESFISAFRRFVARRGRCKQIWSDRGTNFVGADKELRDMWHEANLEIPEQFAQLLAEDGTEWHLIPPYSPNFGGLWEAGVKSIKHHLKRILTRNLTYEEMLTTLCQIEACLNSRPLCPVDVSNVDSLEVLTPGHFLIGEAPINISEPSLLNVNVNKLSRWQHTQRLVQNFWRRWQSEYLTQLQHRPKWQKPVREFNVGDIVLLKEDLPPGKWALGRIIGKHSGQDDLCRVYSIKCRGKTIQRNVSKICELPINE